jgi:hypothetical protein
MSTALGIVEGGCYGQGWPTLKERRVPEMDVLGTFHFKKMSTEELKEAIEYQRKLFGSTHGFALEMRTRLIRYLESLLDAKRRKL